MKRAMYSIGSAFAATAYANYFGLGGVQRWAVFFAALPFFFYLSRYALDYYLQVFALGAVAILILINEADNAQRIMGAKNFLIVLTTRNSLTLSLELLGIAVLYGLIKKFGAKINLLTGFLLVFIYTYFMLYTPHLYEFHHYSAHFGVMLKVHTASFGSSLYSTYGHFSYFLQPLFKIIGLNTVTYGHVMAFLCAISAVSGVILVYKLVSESFLRVLALGLLAYFATVYVRAWTGNYFAVFPLRTLFPMLCALYTLILSQYKDRVLVWLGACLITAFSIVWNPETGLAILAAFGALYIYLKNYQRDLSDRWFYIHGAVAGLGFIFTLGLALLILNMFSYFIAGSFQSFSELMFPILSPFPGALGLPLGKGFALWVFVALLLGGTLLYCLKGARIFGGSGSPSAKNGGLLFLSVNSALVYLYYVNRSAIYNQNIIAFQMVVLLAWALSQASRYPGAKALYSCGAFVMLAITCANISDVFYSPTFGTYLKYKHQPNDRMEALTGIAKKYGADGTPAMGAFGIAYANLGWWKNPLLSLPEPTAQTWAIPVGELVEQFKALNKDRFLYDPAIWRGYAPEQHPLRRYISENYSNIATPEETKLWDVYVMERVPASSLKK